MADQPDWQRFQSSVGPAIYSQTSANPTGVTGVFLGPWRSLFLAASDPDTTVVWSLTFTWSLDAAGTKVVRTETVIIGNAIPHQGWKPVVAPYLAISAVATVPSAGKNLTINVLPSLLEAAQSSRYLAQPMISVYENIINHNNFVTYDCSLITPGPAVITVRANGTFLVIDVSAMNSAGVYINQYRFQPGQSNHAEQFNLVLPEAPTRVVVTNTETFGAITYDFRLDPL